MQKCAKETKNISNNACFRVNIEGNCVAISTNKIAATLYLSYEMRNITVTISKPSKVFFSIDSGFFSEKTIHANER